MSRSTCSEWNSSLEITQAAKSSSLNQLRTVVRVCRRWFVFKTSNSGVSVDLRLANGSDSSSDSKISMTSDSSGSESESSMTSGLGKRSRLLLDGLLDGLLCGRGSERLGSGASDFAVEDMPLRRSSALGCVRARTGFGICVEGINCAGGGVTALKSRP